jgi:SLBB domain
MRTGTKAGSAAAGRLGYRITLGGLLLLCAGLVGANAQQLNGLSNMPAQKSEVGEPASFKYYAWGEVRSPGIYHLGPNLDIVELLSQAGGPTEAADLTRVSVIQGSDQRKITLNVKKALESGNVVSLSPGDIVIVPKSLGYVIRGEITWISTFLLALNLYLTIVSLFSANKA